jgi:LmbE family N-acetylglucosaminyl deacetylase
MLDRADVLVFAPHFDDESLGCGGSIAGHVAEGARVAVVFMTAGDSGSVLPGHEMDAAVSRRVRGAEAQAAARVLGVAESTCLELEDGFLHWEADVVREVVRLLRRCRPAIVYGPHDDEVHSDHQATAAMLADAVPRAGWTVFPALGGEPWSVAEVRSYEVWTPLRRPNLYVDITPYVDIKAEAIRQYVSQLAAIAYHDAVLGLNRYRGAMGPGVAFAEAFYRWEPAAPR